jgi:hypothetical protein
MTKKTYADLTATTTVAATDLFATYAPPSGPLKKITAPNFFGAGPWAIRALTPAPDKAVYFTSLSTAALMDFTSVGRTLVGQSTQALMRTTGLGMSANGSSLVTAADYAAMKVLLNLTIGTDVQAYSAALTSIAGLTTAPDKMIYTTASNVYATTDLSLFGRTLIDDANSAAARSTLGLVIGTDVQAYDADLAALAANSTDGLWARTGAGTGSARTITGTANQIGVTNGDGVSGNPTLALLGNALALSGLTGAADKLAYFTGAAAMALTNLVSQARSFLADPDAQYVNYLQAGTGAATITARAKMRGLPISTADWGITADSNGTTGNGTDWTTQFQALVTYARANGRDIWVPAAPGLFIRFTAPINFTGAQTKMEVIGESNFDSAFFADFTSTSAIAAFSNNASAGARSYVGWRNFRLMGRSDTTASNTVRGIYSNWGGEFSEFESVFVSYFYDNVVIANDFNVKMTRCLLWYAKNNNLNIGQDISGATGSCNNVNIECVHSTHAGGYGIYIYAARAVNISGGGSEANDVGNVFLDLVYGGNISGYYMEYNSAESGNPTSQLRFRNCNGCTVNGLSVSAFDNAGEAVVYVDEGCAGIILNGLAIEQSGADLSAIGVLIRGGTGVQINGGFFDGLTTGIRGTEGARFTIAGCNILATTPVSTDASGVRITWRDAIDSQVTASAASINALALADIIRTTQDKNMIDNTKVFQGVATFGNMASAATAKIIDAELLSEQYRISSIFIGVNDAFAGGGGDRNLAVRTAATVYTTIPAASLQVYGTSGGWGEAAVPWGAAETNITTTAANADLYLQYSGGGTDYTTGGSVVVRVVATRIA